MQQDLQRNSLVPIDVCDAIIAADRAGDLLPRQQRFADQARIIRKSSGKQGIKLLAYAVTGYQAEREEIIASFKRYIEEEAREYEKEFPEELYLAFCKPEQQNI